MAVEYRMLDFYILILLSFVIVFSVLICIKVISEDRRIVLYRLGKYMGVKGPGIVFTIPVVDKAIKIAKGDSGIMRNQKIASFDGSELPVVSIDISSTGQKVKVQGFNDQQILVVRTE